MSESLIFLLCFLVAFAFNINRTYFILFIASALNYGFDPYYQEYSVVLEAELDLTTIIFLYYLGDKHVKWQLYVLFIIMGFHALFEIDQYAQTYWLIGEENAATYENIITTLTIGQLLGAVYGILERVRPSYKNPVLLRHRPKTGY